MGNAGDKDTVLKVDIENDEEETEETNKPLSVNLGDQKLLLDVEEKLGEGAFGSVSRVIDNRGISFAMKSIPCQGVTADETVFNEVEILLQLAHPNIVAMYGFDFIDSSAILIMEYCSQGTLNRKLGEVDEPFEDMLQLQWMEQLASALSYLHSNSIVHRDLKTENVLLTDNNDVKIADFGIARHFVCSRAGRIFKEPNDYITEYLNIYMETLAGTPFWIAPEVLDKKYTEKSDIFSLGLIFHAICEKQYYVVNGKRYYGVFTEYKGENNAVGLVMHATQDVVEPVFHHSKNKRLKEMICYMLQFTPDTRMSLYNIRSEINKAYLTALYVK